MVISLSPQRLSLVLLLLVMVLGAIQLQGPVARLLAMDGGPDDMAQVVFLNADLPRLAMALLCGAGLSVSGAILQQVLRNPLASPDTLGVSAGARLALALCTLLAPALLGLGRDLVAIAGAAISTLIVLFIARRRQFSPLALILTGLILGLYCGAMATILLLLKDRYLVGLFIWGSGSLSQQSWGPALDLLLRLTLCLIPLIVLLRSLSLLDAGEAAARSLGVPIERVRVMAVGLAVLLAAFVTSAVGMIGFIGLAGPLLARLHGRLGLGAWCLWSAVIGALLLLAADLGVQVFAGGGAAFLPTGAVTAVIGAPLLLVLSSRLAAVERPKLDAHNARRSVIDLPQRAGHLWWGVAILVTLLSLLVFVGRAPNGEWVLLRLELFADVMPWRLPRLLGAAGAGGLLAVAGYVLQRVTGNPMASPEILGVSAGAILGAAIAMMFAGTASSVGLTASATLGALAATLLVLTLAIRSPFSAERVLLAGVALTALVDALIGVLTATGDPHAVMLMAWISGSASGTSMPAALGIVTLTLCLLGAAMLGTRWLTILPLGAAPAQGLGVAVPRAQGLMLLLVALMTAVATPVIGPLTFVGLMAPHAVHLMGVRRAGPGLLLSAVVGASLMMLADTLARTIAFPLQLPTGILASLLAGPFLLLLIGAGGTASGASKGQS